MLPREPIKAGKEDQQDTVLRVESEAHVCSHADGSPFLMRVSIDFTHPASLASSARTLLPVSASRSLDLWLHVCQKGCQRRCIQRLAWRSWRTRCSVSTWTPVLPCFACFTLRSWETDSTWRTHATVPSRWTLGARLACHARGSRWTDGSSLPRLTRDPRQTLRKQVTAAGLLVTRGALLPAIRSILYVLWSLCRQEDQRDL